MKTFTVSTLAAICAAFDTAEISAEFMQHLAEYNKNYANTEEFLQRLDNFERTSIEIQAHNISESEVRLGHNHLSDWSLEELENLFHPQAPSKIESKEASPVIGTAPAEFDWRIEEGVTPVKNQLSCGASWAFAAVAAIESAHYANWSQLIPFSEQSFIDCADASCTTGTPSTVYDYASELDPTGNTRLMIRSQDYKYQASVQNCEYSSSSKTKISVTASNTITANSPSALQEAVYAQPVSVGINTAELNITFTSYSNGIITTADCNDVSCCLDPTPNMYATIVGYGTRASDSMQYWIIKNSMGASWGENGYFRVQNTGTDDAGIACINSEGSYPTTLLEL